MRKNKWLLPKTMIYFAFIAINLSCEKDLYDDAVYKPEKSTIKEVKFDELFKDSKFKSLLQSVSNNSNIARSAFENQNGFTISNTNVKVIQTDSVTSYTMLIQRDSVFNSSYFENLVIQEDIFNNQKAFIIKYTPNQITSTVDNSFAFQGKIKKSQIAFTGFNRSGSYQNTTQADCYIEVLMCSYGEDHVAGQGCVDKPNPTLYLKKIAVLCQDNGGGSGGSGDISIGDPFNGGGGSSGSDGDDLGDPFSGGSSSGGSGNGSTNTNNDGFDSEVVTSPVAPEITSLTPCASLKKMLTNSFVKKALDTLKNFTSLEYEKGYSVKKDINTGILHALPAQSSINFPNQIKMLTGGTSIGAFHTHPLAATTNIVPMFSDGDINWLFWVAQRNEAPRQGKVYEEFFLTLTVPQGTYAIKIKDWTKFSTFRNNEKIWINENASRIGILNALRDKYDRITANGNHNRMINAFLEILQEFDAGMGLYEASSDLNAWSELVLAPGASSYNDTQPRKIPCQ